MRAASLLLLVTALLVCPGTAQAGGRVIPLHAGPVGGPAYAGHDIVWTSRTAPREAAVERLSPASVRSTIGRFTTSPYPTFRTVASPSRVSGSAFELSCPGSCKYQNYSLAYSDFFTASLESPLSKLDSSQCPEVTQASGDAVVVHSCLGLGAWRVIDLADGTTHPVPWDMNAPVLAGDYIAAYRSGNSGSGGSVVVRNWRDGSEVLDAKLGPSGYEIALQSDGKVAFSQYESPQQVRLFWASPSEPSPHPLPVVGRSIRPVRFVEDRILGVLNGGFTTDTPEVTVAGIDGSVTKPVTQAPRADFDGRQVVGLRRPCGVAYVVEWDLQGEVPAPPGGACPAATVKRARASLFSPDRSVKIAVTCPSEPASGCHGEVALRSSPAFKRAPNFRSAYYQLEPGETQTFSVPLSWSSLCRPRRGRVTIEARTYSGGLEPGATASTWEGRFTVTGVRSRPHACGR
jgi:hypothetical protein